LFVDDDDVVVVEDQDSLSGLDERDRDVVEAGKVDRMPETTHLKQKQKNGGTSFFINGIRIEIY